jgi:hypothetical protein
MRVLRRRPVGTDANEVAMHTATHSGGTIVTAIVSTVALVFSAYSLWETSLKRADLSVFIPGVVTYARDTTPSVAIQPSGGFEVLAVPVTIANGGARDAAIVALHLDVKNLQTGLSARFEATYTAERALGLEGHGRLLPSELQQRKGAHAGEQDSNLPSGNG